MTFNNELYTKLRRLGITRGTAKAMVDPDFPVDGGDLANEEEDES